MVFPLTLINPGAEDGINGWTIVGGGDIGTTTNPGNGGSDASTHSGARSFVASLDGAAPIWKQTIDIPASEWAAIDGGAYWANARAWIKTISNNEDYGRVVVICLDANGKQLARGASRWICGNNAWREEGAVCVAPAGTRKLVVQAESVRTNGGGPCQVYFDDFTAFLIDPPSKDRSVPHRYWMCVFETNNGDGTYITLDAILWYQGATQYTGGVYDVSQYLDGYPPTALNTSEDGTAYSSLWAGNITRGHAWASYDMGASTPGAPDQVWLYSRKDGYNPQAPRSWRVQWSDDGVNYFDVARFDKADGWGAAERRKFLLTNDRYRLLYLQGGNGTYFTELEFRGVVGGPDLTEVANPASGLGGKVFGDAGNLPPWNVFDNAINDNYIGNTDPNRWVEWHFDSPTEIAEIAISARATVGSQAPSEAILQRSTDQGFTYTNYAYWQTGSFTNGQTKAFSVADGRMNYVVSKVGEYVVEGSPSESIIVSKMGEYIVEGMVNEGTIGVTKMGGYVVEGPDGIHVPKLAEYVVEGPPSVRPGPFVDPGGHRYWRIYNRRCNNDGQYKFGVNDIHFHREDGMNIVNYGGTAIASMSVGGGSGVPANAFDGKTDTLWQTDNNVRNVATNGHGEWIGYDFGDGWTPRIDAISILPNKDDNSRTPFFFELQYSDDGNSWATDWIVCYRGSYSTNVAVPFFRPVFDDNRKARFWALHAYTLMNQSVYNNLGGSEFHMMNEEDGTSLTQGKTTGFRSSSSGSENPNALFDGNVNTSWSASTPSTGGNEYVGCDFGTPIEVRQFTWLARRDNDTLFNQSPTSGSMMRSNDGIIFQPMWQFSGLTYSKGSLVTVKTPLAPDSLVRGRRRNAVSVVF
jgi:hypothetical protein